jgi:hypothetical protein
LCASAPALGKSRVAFCEIVKSLSCDLQARRATARKKIFTLESVANNPGVSALKNNQSRKNSGTTGRWFAGLRRNFVSRAPVILTAKSGTL